MQIEPHGRQGNCLAVLAAIHKPALKRRPRDGGCLDRAINCDRPGTGRVGNSHSAGWTGVTIAGGPRHDLGFAGNTFNGFGTFYFEILGPVGSSTSVQIHILANATTSAPGRDSGAYVEINIPNIFDVNACSGNPTSIPSNLCTDHSPRWPTTLGPSYTTNIQEDSQIPITFYWRFEDFENASITFDPQIVIDPNFLANNPGYSLIFSPDALVAGVPEPATWALLILGFGGVGAMMRHQRALDRAKVAAI